LRLNLLRLLLLITVIEIMETLIYPLIMIVSDILQVKFQNFQGSNFVSVEMVTEKVEVVYDIPVVFPLIVLVDPTVGLAYS
jgi:hypothetical protein